MYIVTNILFSMLQSVEVLKNLNLEPGKDLVKVKARVIAPQNIACNTYTFNAGPRADWTNALHSTPMYTSATVKSWVIVTPNKFVGDVNKFTLSLKKVSDAESFFLSNPIM